MTCIVGLTQGNTVWLGGDRAATGGGLARTIIKDPKVFVRGEVAFGVCGLPKVMDALAHVIELPEQRGGSNRAFLVGKLIPAIRDGLQELDCLTEEGGQKFFQGAMLIGYRGGLYQLECNFQLVASAAGFDAVGSGADPALGSLRSTTSVKDPEERLLEALRVSAENNAGVAPPFDVICVKRSK